MYSFERTNSTNKLKRANRILILILVILLIVIAALIFSLRNDRQVTSIVGEMISARAVSEASDAQSTVYRLTQSSGTNTITLLSNLRAHVYALQSLNQLSSSIYGAGTNVVSPDLLTTCLDTLDTSEMRLQAGRVMTDIFLTLRDEVNEIASIFGL